MRSPFRLSLVLLLLIPAAGLNAQDLWTNAGVPGGAWVYELCAAREFVYAGTAEGVSISTDRGDHWKLTALRRMRVYDMLPAADGSLIVASTTGLYRMRADGSSYEDLGIGAAVLAVAEPRPGVLCAAVGDWQDSESAVWRSGDGGARWERCWTLETGVVTVLCTTPDGDLLCGTASRNMQDEGYIYRSSDEGRSWTSSFKGGKRMMVWTIYRAGAVLYAGGHEADGFYTSTDDGRSWRASCSGVPPSQGGWSRCQPNDFASAWSLVYVATSEGVFVTRTQGATWIPAGLQSEAISSLTTGADGSLYAGTKNGIWRRRSVTAPWERCSEGLTAQFIQAAATAPDGTIYMVNAGGLLYASTDFGCSWTEIPFEGGFPHDILITGEGTLLLATADNELLRREAGSDQWERIPGAVGAFTFPLLDCGGGVILSGPRRSTDGGRTFRMCFDRDFLILMHAGSGILYGATWNSVLHVSSDQGLTWQRTQGQPEMPDGSSLNVRSGLVMRDGAILLGTLNGVVMSRDGGSSWQEAGLAGEQVSALREAADGSLFAGTYENGVFRLPAGSGVWETWSGGMTVLDVRGLCIDPLGYLYATTKGGAFRSANVVTGKQSMFLQPRPGVPRGIEDAEGVALPMQLSSTAAGSAVFRIAVQVDPTQLQFREARPLSPALHVYAARADVAQGLVHLTLDCAADAAGDYPLDLRFTVLRREKQPAELAVSTLPVAPQDGMLTVLRCDETSFIIDGACSYMVRRRPRDVTVEAHPNPFNPATTLDVHLARPGRVQIWIMDLSGRPLRMLADRVMTAGVHALPFDAGALPSGVYFCRVLLDGHATDGGKLVLQR